MKVKKYRAPDRASALKQIKAEMGAEAVILQEQQVRQGPIGRFGKTEVEILAAVEDPVAAATAETSPAAPEDGASRLAAILAQLPKDGRALSPDVAASLADAIAEAADGKLGDLLDASTTPAQDRTDGIDRSEPQPADRPQSAVLRDMERTLVDLRSTVDRIKRQSQPAKPSREPVALRTVYQHLMDQEVEPGLALELIGQIADEVSAGQHDRNVDVASVQARLVDLLRPQLPTRRIDAHKPAKGGPRVIVLVGPTGVGKTTTVAKLAAHLALHDAKRVCLVTTDTFRIAAAAQLGTYADIMRLPLEVVYAPSELPAAIGKQSAADYVIVDTPGCGQHNEPQLRELGAFVEAALSAAPDATVLLAVAAPTKLSDMLGVQDRFGALPLDGLVLTKLDETRAFGPLLSLVRRAEKPVYYVTTGQNVPNDLEAATSDHLARLVVDGPSSALSSQISVAGAQSPVLGRESSVEGAR